MVLLEFDLTAIAILNKQLIIDGLSQGKRIDDLGLPVSRQAVSRALKDDPDYQDAILQYHIARLDKSEDMILDAADNVDVARARAFHDAVRWRASKEQRDVYGDKPDTSSSFGTQGITINIGTVQPPGITVEQEK